MAKFFILAGVPALIGSYFMSLSYAGTVVRQALADDLIGRGLAMNIDIRPVLYRFYDDHHLFLISVGFFVIAAGSSVALLLFRRAGTKTGVV